MSTSEHGDSGFEQVQLSPQSRAELIALAAELAEARSNLDSAGEPLATIIIPASRDDGTICGLPRADYHPAVQRFWKAVHRLHLCADPFDWPSWLGELRASGADPLDPALADRFSLRDIRRYLTMLERVERFVDGTWRTAIERGVFEAVIGRLVALDNRSSSRSHRRDAKS